ncbi:hypothetical protein TYRP_022786 [Tyrophagus putrescentiae]|nr:hypothetical protein TYRP_022786 [Tyrophagus putrescentiae]
MDEVVVVDFSAPTITATITSHIRGDLAIGEWEREREGGVRGRPRIIGEPGERLRDRLRDVNRWK